MAIPSHILTELNRKDISPQHSALLTKVKELIGMSRSKMSQYYDEWDRRDKTYRGERTSDKDDEKEVSKGGMEKFVVPLSYAQIQTFCALGFSMFFQRDFFFELEGQGEEDHRPAKLGEALLDKDLQYNCWAQKLYQLLLDVARFSIGIQKHSWMREVETVWVKEQQIVPKFNLLGRSFGVSGYEEVDVKKEQTAFIGNKIMSVSPYRFYPDTRLPLSRFQEGEFCASEDEISRTELLRGEANGLYAGIKYIPDMTQQDYERRGPSRLSGISFSRQSMPGRGGNKTTKPPIVVTEVQIDLVPSEWKFGGFRLGNSEVPEKWVICYANDARIIKMEPMGYAHNNFTYSVAQFSPDQQRLINESLAGTIDKLQSVIDWFINSHIANVRKHISNRLVVDPSGVEFDDIQQHRPIIRLKPEASKSGVERWVQQLNVTDITRNHITDAMTILKFVHMVTSISDNLMGQPASGRRSAREMGNAFQAGMARMKMIFKLIWESGLAPMGRDMLSNHRDGLDEATFVAVSGELFPDWQAFQGFKSPTNNGKVSVQIDRTAIAGRYDFKVFEGTLPSEKSQQAETIENILLALIKSPQGVPILTGILGYDPQKLFKEVLELRGIKHPDRFKLDQVRAQQLQQEQLTNPLLNPQLQQNGLNGNGGIQQGGIASLVGNGGTSSSNGSRAQSGASNGSPATAGPVNRLS